MFAPRSTPDLRLELAALHRESFVWALHCCRGDAGRAEDALQEAYLKILTGRARFGGRSSFKTWLLALIRLTAADEWRRAERHTARLAAWNANPPESVVTPDDALAVEQTQAGVRAALTGLPARQREVLTLVFYHDLTLDEAAGVMGLSPGTARTHYDRAKSQLRATLARCEMLP
jgi:RNA polymerase sigma factor (sigma-70 family)